jgi:hypothetical protein
VDQALKQSLTKKNIKSRFKTLGIWPINPKAMDSNIKPSKVYIITTNINNAKSEEDYTTKEEVEKINNGGGFCYCRAFPHRFNIQHLKIYLHTC